MDYTREEIETIKNHIRAIENFCKTEIAPYIDGRYVYVDFSETQYRSNGSPFKKTYGFCVECNGIATFTSSALSMVIDENFERTSYSVNAYAQWIYMVELLERWQTVKAKMLDQIREERERKAKILSFQV